MIKPNASIETVRVCIALSNQGQFLIFQGLKITEVQGSAILTHIFQLQYTKLQLKKQ